MKFRIKHIPKLGYWPQVKKSWGSGWKRISKHLTGFGLYGAGSIDYPHKDQDECIAVIIEYKKWLVLAAQNPTYMDVL